MKRLFTIALSWVLLLSAASVAFADQYIRGYSRRDGTYVQPHWRSEPDSNPYNNYSYPGNINPYTGKQAPGNPDTYLNQYYQRQYQSPSPNPWGTYGR